MHIGLHCIDVFGLRECIFQCFTEALYERKQNVASGTEFAKLQSQVEQWESIAKESQGKATCI